MSPTRRLRPSLGPVVLSVAAGTAVLLSGLFVNSCRINKLLGGGATATGAPQGQMEVTPSEVRDSALSGTLHPRRSVVEIENNGRWVATTESGWIGLSPRSGNGQTSVSLALDPEGLKPGQHTGTITFSEPGSTEAPVVVSVTLFIQQPVLDVSPKDLSRTTRSSNAQFFDTLVVKNKGTGPLEWTASNGSSWLTLETSVGIGEGRIALKMSSTGLGISTYRDTIVVVAAGALGSPTKIPVSFKRRRGDDDDH